MTLRRGLQQTDEPPPDLIQVTSLFTYAWKPVHQAIEYYRRLYPHARIELGGIYATLMPEHAKLSGADNVHTGLVPDSEPLLPDYSLMPDWDSSLLFGTRGCIRKCAFCAVPRLEGKVSGPARRIAGLISPDHRKVVLWDNNVLGVPNWREIIDELAGLNLEVDFNQGLDARLIDDDVARQLARVRVRPIRLAYDSPGQRRALTTAIPALMKAGFKSDKIIVYTLYNFTDTPEDFLERLKDLLSWDVTCYPMRYEPLDSLVKNRYVSPHWNAKQVEMVARARRVVGVGGAFPPYPSLVRKILGAQSFAEAFSLQPRENERAFPEGVSGIIEDLTPNLSEPRSRYREMLNDPTTLLTGVRCKLCSTVLPKDHRAFALQDYSGRYVGYACPPCHPNRTWINGLWRSTFTSPLPIGGHNTPLLMASTPAFSRPAH